MHVFAIFFCSFCGQNLTYIYYCIYVIELIIFPFFLWLKFVLNVDWIRIRQTPVGHFFMMNTWLKSPRHAPENGKS